MSLLKQDSETLYEKCSSLKIKFLFHARYLFKMRPARNFLPRSIVIVKLLSLRLDIHLYHLCISLLHIAFINFILQSI